MSNLAAREPRGYLGDKVERCDHRRNGDDLQRSTPIRRQTGLQVGRFHVGVVEAGMESIYAWQATAYFANNNRECSDTAFA